MWSKISEVPLKTNDIMEIHVVKAPDDHYKNSIMSFLVHNKGIWLWHLNLAVQGELDELESRFYLGLLKSRIISNVSTWEYGSIGIIGHLFTAKDHRKKGACTALIKTQIEDFRKRGGQILIGGFKESSYPIVKNLGFTSIINNSEVMRYNLYLDYEKEYFQAKRVFCRDAMWKDWPSVSLLFTAKEGWRVRSMRHKIFGPFDYEDYFLEDMSERLKSLCMSKVLVTEEGSIVGYATLALKHRLSESFWLLDFFIHPASVSYADAMLEAMYWPKGKIRCYVEAECRDKHDMLLARGFQEKRILKKQIKRDGKTLNIIAMECLKK